MSTHEVTDPFEYLKKDHKKVGGLLDKIAKTSERAEKTREELFEELSDCFALHASIEEEIVYPILKEKKQTHDITLEAFEEHHVVKELILELSEMEADTEEWTAKLTVLKENIEHHVKEEEGEMFPKAHKALGKNEQSYMADLMTSYIKKHAPK